MLRNLGYPLFFLVGVTKIDNKMNDRRIENPINMQANSYNE